MNPSALAKAFREGAVWGPRGAIRAQAAMLTRRSLLVFTPQTVLKVRVPVDVGRERQSLLSVRVAQAERERYVGRRLAADAYLDDCALRLSPEGDILLVHELREGEPVVATRRQPLERRADVVVTEGPVTPELFAAAMQQLATFHETAPEPDPSERWARPTLAAERWRGALALLAAAAPPELLGADERQRLADETEEWLAALDKVLLHRVTERRIRDGHGELSLEHLFLVDVPVWIDADDGGRPDEHLIDTAEDVMRLGMELDLVVGRELSDAVMERYADLAVDLKLPQVAPLYKRLAAVRAAAEVLGDPGLDAPAERARAFIELALGYTLR